MTWQHFSRALIVVVSGAVALESATHARAEGGEEPSVLLPRAFDPDQGTTGVAGDAAGPLDEGSTQPTATRSRTRGLLSVGGPLSDAVRAIGLKPLIARYASENALPYELADAIIRLESRYNPQAHNGINLGLTQVNLRTAQSLGYKGDAAGLLEVETNLHYGLKYLARAYALAGGDTCGTILRYQFGHRTQAMTAASRAYCARVKTIIAAAD
jgi:hypothetical protein